MDKSELRPQQRAGLLAWLLAKGVKLSTANAAQVVGLSERATYDLLCTLSGALPIVLEGRWQDAGGARAAGCAADAKVAR